MLRRPLIPLRRVLITLDAVGGIWRYALDVALGLEAYDVTCLLAVFGPEPSAAQQAECKALPNADLVCVHEPLDWMVTDAAQLEPGVEKLAGLARDWKVDLLHLNLPSQAAGLDSDVPVVVASHSCVPTWWEAVHGTALPKTLEWQRDRNRQGFRQADAIMVPSASHGAALRRAYEPLPPLHVVYNSTSAAPSGHPREKFILSVGRWWDTGKNGQILDAAAKSLAWPVVLAGPLHGPDGQATAFHHARTPGALAHEDILSLMERASIFAGPSRYEPFGLAVAEAAASGSALVLADIATFRELWDGAALFVGADDTAEWANAFSTLIENEPLRRQLAADAQSRAQRFTLPRQAARLYELYSELGAAAMI
jgi:glycosyltransferase involved in cell wall biosynthesis